VIVVKEVKFSVTVDEHDYQTKKNQAVRFLHGGDKVKASLRFRGRQMAHRELGYAIINRLIQDIGETGNVVEFMPRMEGTILHAIHGAFKEAGSSQAQARRRSAGRRLPRRAPQRRRFNKQAATLRTMRAGRPLRAACLFFGEFVCGLLVSSGTVGIFLESPQMYKVGGAMDTEFRAAFP
jgi:hypothetical protein